MLNHLIHFFKKKCFLLLSRCTKAVGQIKLNLTFGEKNYFILFFFYLNLYFPGLCLGFVTAGFPQLV